MKKYLFIGFHTDDIELSCGATVRNLVEYGNSVSVHAISSCGSIQLEDEFYAAMKILGVTDYIIYREVGYFGRPGQLSDTLYRLRNSYDFVITHSENCRHPDHRSVAEESKRIFNGSLITYLQPWNGNEDPNYFVELSEGQLNKKIQALACYKSQAHRPYMSEEFIRAQARYNGIKCGKLYAEAFKIEKLIQ